VKRDVKTEDPRVSWKEVAEKRERWKDTTYVWDGIKGQKNK